jgi:uncharacterized protein (TIGR02466 family)
MSGKFLHRAAAVIHPELPPPTITTLLIFILITIQNNYEIIHTMLVNWPSPFLFWTEVENHDEIKKELVPKIREQSQDMKYYNKPMQVRKPGDSNWNCEVITTYFDREDSNKLFSKEILYSIISKPLESLLSEQTCPIKTKPQKTSITEIWYNVYKEGYEQEIHAHHGATISGIYLLELNEPNTTVFFSHSSSFSYERNNFYTGSYPTEHITEGNVILFPSEFAHAVKKSQKSRISISFNLLCEFKE